jgi:hypothetical protein
MKQHESGKHESETNSYQEPIMKHPKHEVVKQYFEFLKPLVKTSGTIQNKSKNIPLAERKLFSQQQKKNGGGKTRKQKKTRRKYQK